MIKVISNVLNFSQEHLHSVSSLMMMGAVMKVRVMMMMMIVIVMIDQPLNPRNRR